MNIKERRKSIRVPLISESCAWADNTGTVTECPMTDINNNGIYLVSSKQPKPGGLIEVRFKLPGDLGIIPVPSKVIWIRWAVTKDSKFKPGFAVEFQLDAIPNIKKILDSYCIYLRNKQIIQVSKRIIEEFFTEPNL